MTGKRKAPATKAKKGDKPEDSTLRRRVKKTLKWSGITFLVLALLGALTFVVLYKSIDIPDPNEAFQTQTTFVYYDDEKTELGRFATQNRDSIPLDEVPQKVQDAVIAAENRSFWTDRGIDPKGILRAAFSNAQGNAQQGASTITQQYVKILYLTQERSYKRKVREAIVSLKLQREMSKSEILEGYLNTIYFGRGAYGIEAASHAFFGKKAKELNLRESVVLASVINNPTRFDPANGKENRAALKERYDYVLSGMADMGTIPAARAEKAARKLPKFPKVDGEQSYAGQKGHMLEMIKKELVRLGFSEQEINGGGLKVYTTLDQKAMNAAREGVAEARPEGRPKLHVAVASVEPGTGALRGFYGGQDYLKSQINWAVTGGQPGSTFKMFAIAAGIDAGYSLKDTFDGNSPYTFPNGTDRVRNTGAGDGTDYGQINMIKAAEDSVNTAFIDLTMSIPNGPQKILEMATKMGIPKAKKSNQSMDNLRDSPGLIANSRIALGTATVSPINMANAYATLANKGKAAPIYLIEKVVDQNGVQRYRHKVNSQQVLPEDIAADVSFALQEVVRNGSGANAQSIGRPAAGKTGTATNADDEVSSSWFVGYTPQLATAVMYTRGRGNESLEGFLVPFFGATYPTQTWSAVMSRALEGEEVLEFPEPVYVDGEAPEDGHEYVPPPPPKTKKPKPKKTKTEEPSDDPTTEEPTPTDPPTSESPSPSDPPTSEEPPCDLLGNCPTDDPSPTNSPTSPGGGQPPGGGSDKGDKKPATVRETTRTQRGRRTGRRTPGGRGATGPGRRRR